ncbi:MAG: hypothetical protein ACOCRX_06275 [Candidatus Woesearchaeota archaeon]
MYNKKRGLYEGYGILARADVSTYELETYLNRLWANKSSMIAEPEEIFSENGIPYFYRFVIFRAADKLPLYMTVKGDIEIGHRRGEYVYLKYVTENMEEKVIPTTMHIYIRDGTPLNKRLKEEFNLPYL